MLQCNMEIFVMATFWHGASAGSAPTMAVSAGNRLSKVGSWFAERRVRAQALRELMAMDDRDLRDLRISPYDFNDIANGTYRR